MKNDETVEDFRRYQRLIQVKLIETNVSNEGLSLVVRGAYGNLYKVKHHEDSFLTCTCPDASLWLNKCKHILFVRNMFAHGHQPTAATCCKDAGSIIHMLNRIRANISCFQCTRPVEEPTFEQEKPKSRNYCLQCSTAYCSECVVQVEDCQQCHKPFKGRINVEGYVNVHGKCRSEYSNQRNIPEESTYKVVRRYKKYLARKKKLEQRNGNGKKQKH